MVRTCTCAYQGVRNVSFSKYFVNVLNKWLLMFIQKSHSGLVFFLAFSFLSLVFSLCNASENIIKVFTHFAPLVSFYTPWKHQKTRGFLIFSGGYRKRAVVRNGLIRPPWHFHTLQSNVRKKWSWLFRSLKNKTKFV